MSMTPEEKRARIAEQKRRYREANKEKVEEQKRRWREANKEKVEEQKRRWREANKEKVAKKKRRYREANREKEEEKRRRYHDENKEKIAEQKRRYREANKKKDAKKRHRWRRHKTFAKEDGSSFQAWLASLYNPTKVFESIANLQPDPSQTLAELIHELSGYAMEVCEQIANPTVIEDSPALTPPPTPDLF